MTGYGRAVQTFENREITVEIRSVNNRYLDCSVKLPRVFGFAEDSVKAKVKEEISRGKVDVFISVNVTAGSDMKISLNRPGARRHIRQLRRSAGWRRTLRRRSPDRPRTKRRFWQSRS